ncbi:MAG TPA: hypothetical protein PL074_09745, partial [Thermoflexales bacterium]|nr:hypothetical protein [Thermoflexales bacterium]
TRQNGRIFERMGIFTRQRVLDAFLGYSSGKCARFEPCQYWHGSKNFPPPLHIKAARGANVRGRKGKTVLSRRDALGINPPRGAWHHQ